MEDISWRCLSCNQNIPKILRAFSPRALGSPGMSCSPPLLAAPAKCRISWNAEVSAQVCRLCVWVFTDLSWPDPGSSQPAGKQLPLNTFPGKIFQLGSSHGAQLTVKRRQKRQNQPFGDTQEIFRGIFNKLKASVIVSYYCRNKSQYRDKGDLEASRKTHFSPAVLTGEKIRGKTEGCK